ncbi:hypothetical protein PMI04_003445 [Sphingobium sp. AP49]|uniref:hypothetical protein n=1 Tax=Sphingobium sp. AP49 TaxID=1144307 RepID=UPI00026EDFAA|nr:hypothetical protein [Sphingobium sp. AP49]WHO39662.1 hypothetical protein PMI04_003445 [Sphingobium sp. AP49]
MRFRRVYSVSLVLLTSCGPKPPEVVQVGDAFYRFPRDPFYRSITDEGASKPTFVAYVTPEKDRRRSISLQYDSRENREERVDAEKQGLPYIFRGDFRLAKDKTIETRPWGTSICLMKGVKLGLLGQCATSMTYRGARWIIYFQHEMLDGPVDIVTRSQSLLKTYAVDPGSR